MHLTLVSPVWDIRLHKYRDCKFEFKASNQFLSLLFSSVRFSAAEVLVVTWEKVGRFDRKDDKVDCSCIFIYLDHSEIGIESFQ